MQRHPLENREPSARYRSRKEPSQGHCRYRWKKDVASTPPSHQHRSKPYDHETERPSSWQKSGARSGLRPWPSPKGEPVLQKLMKCWGENEVKGFGDGERLVALVSGGKTAVAGRSWSYCHTTTTKMTSFAAGFSPCPLAVSLNQSGWFLAGDGAVLTAVVIAVRFWGKCWKMPGGGVADVLNFCGLTYGLYCDNGNGHFVKIETCTICTATTETVISLILKYSIWILSKDIGYFNLNIRKGNGGILSSRDYNYKKSIPYEAYWRIQELWFVFHWHTNFVLSTRVYALVQARNLCQWNTSNNACILQ